MFGILKRQITTSRPDPKSSDSAQEYNRKLNVYLSATGIVDSDLYSDFKEAYGYNAAGTFSWLNAKISILRLRIEQGKSIYIYNPDSKMVVELRHTSKFLNWLKLNFPEL
jgi:hypothetical protein